MSEIGDLLPEDPRSIGAYTLVGRIGAGGQGTVFAGRSAEGHQVAVKLLHLHLLTDDRAQRRFLSEFETAKRVAPFSAARVLDAGVAGRWPFIVTEYVEGPSLQQSVQQSGPRSVPALERLAINTATALAAIHHAGVVHLDFKPSNVLLGPDGPVVIDFGISRALDLSVPQDTSRPMGTPGYMAPEMITGGDVGPAADLFAWGATMVYAANGTRAFDGDSGAAVVRATLHGEPDLSRLDDRLRGLVQACLAKDPALRPTAAQVVEHLRGTAAPPAVTATRRRWVPVAAVAAAALITAGVGYVILSPGITQADRGATPPVAGSAPFSPSPTPTLASTSSSSSASPSKKPTPGHSTPKPSRSRSTPHPTVKPSRSSQAQQPTTEPRQSTKATNKPTTKATTKAPEPSKTAQEPATVGTVDTGDLEGYCKSKGYLMFQNNSDGTHTCSLPAWNSPADTPGTLDVTWTDACRWKYPEARDVTADGQTCKGN
ncbi:protein kinase [Nonomuraea sp. NPDC050556]|uniref:serine/threonine protein kinase n=1 Tax=Nonomuraea sp. NPDC050556 TaxID=3364369 RepID=UPI00378D6FF4